MTDPTNLPTYGAVRNAWVRDRERDYRRRTRSIPTEAQRAQWSAEFDRWADAIRAITWDEAAATIWDANTTIQEPDDPYRKD